jgi:uncharacterized repeat protein (TIGR03806 family)
LEVAGDSKIVNYIDENGTKQVHAYSIPNLNQCKGCHNRNEKMTPIGPSARQLNGELSSNDKNRTGNQLLNWVKQGILKDLPDLANVPKAAIWNKPETGSLNDRTRAYLDINCAHCHRPEGPANSSGLNLSIHNHDLTTLGINKAPVAAGRGSGGRLSDIIAGKPDESILLFRMNATDPSIMMPEVGRKRTHTQGVALVRDWILEL